MNTCKAGPFLPGCMKTPYNYDRRQNSARGALPSGPTKTRQSQADEADINKLVARYGLGGAFPAPARLPEYQDFDDIFDFQSAMDTLNAAEKTFQSIPAKLRARFENNPQKFLEFVTDPENKDELVKLGLRNPDPPPPPEPPPTPVP